MSNSLSMDGAGVCCCVNDIGEDCVRVRYTTVLLRGKDLLSTLLQNLLMIHEKPFVKNFMAVYYAIDSHGSQKTRISFYSSEVVQIELFAAQK